MLVHILSMKYLFENVIREKTLKPFIDLHFPNMKRDVAVSEVYDVKTFVNYSKHRKLLFSGENLNYSRTVSTLLDKCRNTLPFRKFWEILMLNLPAFILRMPIQHPYSVWKKRIHQDKNMYSIISNSFKGPRILNLPLFFTTHYGKHLNIEKNRKKYRATDKDKFCSFVVGNPVSVDRIKFFRALSKYKKVDSLGSYLNNTGIFLQPATKVSGLTKYRFNICFENTVANDYITEKLFDAFEANCIPIYKGAPNVGDYVNKKAFINYDDYGSDDAVIKRVIELEENPAELKKMMSQPIFDTPAKLKRVTQLDKTLLNFYKRVFFEK